MLGWIGSGVYDAVCVSVSPVTQLRARLQADTPRFQNARNLAVYSKIEVFMYCLRTIVIASVITINVIPQSYLQLIFNLLSDLPYNRPPQRNF